MDISLTLTPQLEASVQKQINSGAYASANKFLEEALQYFISHKEESKEDILRVRKLLQDGYNSGRVKPRSTAAIIESAKSKYNR